MKYQSGGAFRRALETRLREQSLASGLPLIRLRKMVSFDRLLARLNDSQPDQWILKGGLALQLRLGDRARTTKDIDLLFLKEHHMILNQLREAVALNLGDWFQFEVGQPPADQAQTVGGIRHTVHSLLDGRTFERFHVDVGVGDPVIEDVEYLATPDLLSFAEIEPVIVPCYPISQQLAEKLHAYTNEYTSGRSTRMKDFVDLLLLATLGQISGASLSKAIKITFLDRGTHEIPPRLPPPPKNWEQGFKRMTAEVGLSEHDLGSSYSALQRFIDPILTGAEHKAYWNPEFWAWG